MLVKFAMRYTHPLITKSRYKYLTGEKIKGGIRLRQYQQEKDSKGHEKLLISDIKNSHLITKVSKILNEMIDETIIRR